MSATSIGLGVLIDSLANPDSAGTGPVDWESFQVILGEISNALQIIADTMDAADSNTQEAVTAATDAATQIEEVGADLKAITEHTYGTVIPHSLSWLAGFIVSHWIDPLRRDVAYLKERVAFLLGWRGQIDSWRRNFVDPNVEKWVGFRQWFDTWPQSVLFRWHEWFERPDEFAQWATPPLVGPIVSYLAGKEHTVSRDNLSLIMTQAWQEVPNRTWELILQYMVTEK